MRTTRSLACLPLRGENDPGFLISYQLFKIRPAFSRFNLINHQLFKNNGSDTFSEFR